MTQTLAACPPLISGLVADPKHYIDNLFADTWKKLKMNSPIRGAGFTKRSGIDVTEALFALLLCKWLNMSSITMFSGKALGTFLKGQKKCHVRFAQTGGDQLACAY
jgi:hypothetical protein